MMDSSPFLTAGALYIPIADRISIVFFQIQSVSLFVDVAFTSGASKF